MKTELNEYIIRLIILTVYTLFLVGYFYYLHRTKAFEMDSEPLTKQRLFKAVFIVPIVSFLTFGTVSWLGHSFKLDSEGLNNFLNISKLPLALLSLSVPFGVIVNNIHRTIQTDTQIKEAQRKNKADAFYSHRKNTIEIMEKIVFPTIKDDSEKKQYNLKIRSCYQLYREFFPTASTESSAIFPDDKIILFLDRAWGVIATVLRTSSETNSLYDEIVKINSIERYLQKINSYLHLTFTEEMDVFKKHVINDKIKYEFRTKFVYEEVLKDSLFAYMRATYEIMFAVGLNLDKSLTEQMSIVEDYVRQKELLYKRWETEIVSTCEDKKFALIAIEVNVDP